MKVKCIVKYLDRMLSMTINVGDELDVTEDRGNELINAGVATPTEVVTEKAPKKSKKKAEG